MKNRVFLIVFVLVIFLAVFSSGCTSGNDTDSTTPAVTASSTVDVTPDPTAGTAGPSDRMSVAELTAFMDEAVDYAKSVGTVGALSEFGNEKGEFSSGDLYVYAYGFNGTLLAHPYQPELVGTDRSEWTDARGFPFWKASAYVAESGGGFIAYLYPKPEAGSIDEAAKGGYVPKIGCVMPVDSEWWIGSGVYLSDLVDQKTGSAPAAPGEMISLVDSGVAYALENGNKAAFEAISDKEGRFVDTGGHYLYAYDYNGTLLAHPYLTDRIGEGLTNHTGAFGEKDIGMLITVAQDGGGYVVFSWPNPENDNKPEIKIGYVLPVNDEWWLGSGVYLSEITGDEESISS